MTRYFLGVFIGFFISSMWFHTDLQKHDKYISGMSYWNGCIERKVEKLNKDCNEMADGYVHELYE